MTLQQAIEKTLATTKQPMKPHQIYEYILKSKLYDFSRQKTPIDSITSIITRDIKHKPAQTSFIKFDKGLFGIKTMGYFGIPPTSQTKEKKKKTNLDRNSKIGFTLTVITILVMMVGIVVPVLMNNHSPAINNLYTNNLAKELNLLTTATFEHAFDELVISEGEIISWSGTNVFLTLANNTSFTRFTPVRFEWRKNGEHLEWSGNSITNLDNFKINPAYENTLSGNMMSSFPVGWTLPVTQEDAGNYTLRVYIADEFIAESHPIRFAVLPRP